ncbi:hypothetical protein HYR99_25390 [Candidatus Poribacteria bacterium]|nr:hypothetical protein [Candidatus Poribacteria bacterium]
MTPAILKLVCTFLEILGAFFLAAEAIKVHNLRKLREQILTVTVLRINPIARSLQATSRKQDLPATYFGILVLIGALVMYGLLAFRGIRPSSIWTAFGSFVPGPLLVDLAVALPIAFVLIFILSLVGSFFCQVVSVPLLVAIVLLDLVERYAASGLVGILGFLFLLIGAILKAYLDWIGA